MRADILIKALEAEKLNVRRPAPVGKYVRAAYDNLISKIRAAFAGDSVITDRKIDLLKITDHMKDKLKDLARKSYRDTTRDDLLSELTTFMGIGTAKAQSLVDQGLQSTGQLRESPWFDQLSVQTKTMLRAEPSQKIPHKHIATLEKVLKGAKVRGMRVKIVGSYRRNAEFSRDIDIMVVSDTSCLEPYLSYIRSKFTCSVYNYGPEKMSLVFDPSPLIPGAPFYKMDAFLTSRKSEPTMLLYATGSKGFNIRMRSKAKTMGYLLNQNGMYLKKNGKLRDVSVKSERDIFDKLGMTYMPPSGRGP